MPKLVSELASGQQYQFSSKEGQVTASQTRVFKVILSSPGEYIDIQQVCGVYIGDFHPVNVALVCTNYSAQYEGDSRMVVVCTFTYEASAGSSNSQSGQDPKQFSPDIRPANWWTSSSIIEVPVYSWRPVTGDVPGDAEPATNPVGDAYEGITEPQAIVTITVEQFQQVDPTVMNSQAGVTNAESFRIGTLAPGKRTVMFRGVQSKPVIESWRGQVFRGWMCSYEFVYKRNYNSFLDADIGWDIVVPQSGYNVKAFLPLIGNADDDPYGQPLKHINFKIDNPLSLSPLINAGDKVRAMVRVFEYENGGTSQAPSASPVPLNDDGRPRKESADPKVLLKRYCVTKPVNFSTFGLRLTQ